MDLATFHISRVLGEGGTGRKGGERGGGGKSSFSRLVETVALVGVRTFVQTFLKSESLTSWQAFWLVMRSCSVHDLSPLALCVSGFLRWVPRI
jgi:hypothetical protein